MGSARGKYEISPELAIKREMAYREHLELMQLIKSTEAKQVPASSNHLYALQPTSVPASRPTSETTQTRPSQIPNPRPKLSANSSPNSTRKPGSSFSVPWPKTMNNPIKLLPRDKPKAEVSSNRPTSMHTSKPTSITSMAKDLTRWPKYRSKAQFTINPFWPECSSIPNLRMHFMGQKHKAQAMKGKGVGQSMEIETRLYCDLCDIWCMNEFSLKQHVSGKSHTLKLHTAERKN
uniref:C2H2-type domain-containing protein n=1 Tax=Chenopodium quinoa TaxID=63459 RepID=A0A803L9D6_CHEQI